MEASIDLNPYKAGPGLKPPYLAGRKYETKIIGSTLDAINGGAGPLGYSPDPFIVLTGPHGVGKTVLLARATKLAIDRKIHIAELDIEVMAGPQEMIVSQVFKEGVLEKLFDKVKGIGLSFMGTGGTVSLNEAKKNLKSALLAYLTKGPVLMYLDEAHRCEPGSL